MNLPACRECSLLTESPGELPGIVLRLVPQITQRLVRAEFQAQLLQPTLARRFLPKVCDISQQFATHLAGSLQAGKVDKFEEEVYKWALESIASIALNKTLGCISTNPDQECLQMIKESLNIVWDS